MDRQFDHKGRIRLGRRSIPIATFVLFREAPALNVHTGSAGPAQAPPDPGPPSPLRRALGLIAATLLGTLLTACGSGGQPGSGGGGKTTGNSNAVAKVAGCNPGKAGTPDFTLAVPQEPDADVAKIDGKCWAAIAYTGMPNNSTGTVPSQDVGQFKVAWSPTNLYFLAWIQEWPLNAAGAKQYMDDTVEFYFSGDNSKDSSYGPTACHYDITFNGTAGAGSTCNADTSGLKSQAKVVQGKGYYAELTVPWSAVSVSKAAKGQPYAFTLQYDVADANGSRVGQNQWAGGANTDAGKTADWGTITLS